MAWSRSVRTGHVDNDFIKQSFINRIEIKCILFYKPVIEKLRRKITGYSAS